MSIQVSFRCNSGAWIDSAAMECVPRTGDLLSLKTRGGQVLDCAVIKVDHFVSPSYADPDHSVVVHLERVDKAQMNKQETCEFCRHWAARRRAEVDPEDRCRHPKLLQSGEVDVDGAQGDEGHGSIWTGPDFGCIHWQAKELAPCPAP